jgi:hypothetical protein
MPPSLAQLYPEIRTYTAEAVGAPYITAKLDQTPLGFHVRVFGAASNYLIRPPHPGDRATCLVYDEKDEAAAMIHSSVCKTGDDTTRLSRLAGNRGVNDSTTIGALTVGGTRRQFRIAIGCTGEFVNAAVGPGSTKAQVLAFLNTRINEVNGLFERELAVRFQLVAGETSLIYLDPATDPFTNVANSPNWQQENQTNTDAVIGNANYDIGMLFTDAGSGIAMMGVLCQSGYKACSYVSWGGYNTVVHEMGHLFNAYHTFNHCPGGTGSACVEPNSGSTIMSYAGACSPYDLQNAVDNYYHSNSLMAMAITLNNVASCPVIVNGSTPNASIPSLRKTYSIPMLTPFALQWAGGTVSPRDTALLYAIEEQDYGVLGTSLANTGAVGPLFRVLPPDTNLARVFPKMSAILGQTQLSGEKLPSAARKVNFRVVERNYYQGWGAFNIPEDSIILDVINTKSAFAVIRPNKTDVWGFNGRQFITWDVVGTDKAPISCPFVDIFLSKDGGQTFPILLAANTPNDGVERVMIPIVHTTMPRVKISCTNNVFFNISEQFNISPAGGVEGTLLEGVSISPVPAVDELHISLPAGIPEVSLQAINSIGQVMMEAVVKGNANVSVASWPRGVYYIRLEGKDGGRVVREVVLR